MASPTGIPSNAAGPGKYSREIVLLTTLLLLLVFAIFTAFAARMYHKRYHVLGDDWFARGDQDFHSGNAAAALSDYRNALLYSPGNTNFQFHLAKALAATGRNDEARAYLVALLSDSPGSGETNLELARIAAQGGPKMMPDALRYYHAAIYGVWDADPIAMRWQVRKEFCEYLLDNNAMNQAEAEIIALADNTSPEDFGGEKTAGNLLLRARMWGRALQQFQSLLSHDPRDEDALAGAATAAFQLAQYAQAEEYLERLPREKLSAPELARMHEISRRVLSLNPFALGLSTDEKAKRTAEAIAVAQARANACERQNGRTSSPVASTSALASAMAKSSQNAADWTARNLRKYPERIEPAMSSVFDLEDAAAGQCGEPQGADYALWLMGRSRAGNSK
jgi:thioredoxin-like negative regulator of GroEL